MSARILEGPDVIALVQDVIDRDNRLNVAVAALRATLSVHATRGLDIEPVMQVLRNVLEEITQVSRWSHLSWHRLGKNSWPQMRPPEIPGYPKRVPRDPRTSQNYGEHMWKTPFSAQHPCSPTWGPTWSLSLLKRNIITSNTKTNQRSNRHPNSKQSPQKNK